MASPGLASVKGSWARVVGDGGTRSMVTPKRRGLTVPPALGSIAPMGLPGKEKESGMRVLRKPRACAAWLLAIAPGGTLKEWTIAITA